MRIPNTEVWSHDGQRFRFYDDLVKNRVVLINVFFATCGDTCPLVTANLRRLQDLLKDQLGREVFMYSITLQPEHDTQQALTDYVAPYDIGPGWLFLTGKPPEVEDLRRSLGFTSPDPEADVIADEHTGMLRFGNDQLDRWGGIPALSRPALIAKSIRNSVLFS